MQSFDVIIAGGGMVGLALACGLQGSGLRVAVLEQRQPEMAPPSEQPALRVSAINAASERLLQHIGVWDDILQLRASAYNAMEVWIATASARLLSAATSAASAISATSSKIR